MRKMPVGAVKMIGQIGAALAASSQVGPNMNDKRSTDCGRRKDRPGFPCHPAFEYVILVDRHIGRLRRAALSASRWRVNSFSRVSKSFRATSHSASDTISRFNSVSASFILFFLRLNFLSVPHVRRRPWRRPGARSCTRPGRSSSVVFGSSCQITTRTSESGGTPPASPPLLLAPERSDVEVVPSVPHLFVATIVMK